MLNLDISGTAKEIFDRYSRDYNNVKNTLESVVVEWKWATGLMYEARPIGRYVYGTPGDWIEKKKGNIVFQYGIDSSGKILIGRRYDRSVCDIEKFFIHTPQRVISLQYNHWESPELYSTAAVEIVNGISVSCTGIAQSVKWQEQFKEIYTYDGQILTRADLTGEQNGTPNGVIFDLDYDSQGVLQEVFARSSKGHTYVPYRRPGFIVESKVAVEARVSAEVTRELQAIINKFTVEHDGEGWYGFAIVTSVQGGIFSCALATEKNLDVIARKYADKDYTANNDETIKSLREWLRWAHPEDGWYIYGLKDVEVMLRPVTDRGILSQREIEKILLEALRDLDASGGLGTEKERQSLIIGLAYVEDTEQFQKTAKKLNPASCVKQFIKEIKRRNELAAQIAKQI